MAHAQSLEQPFAMGPQMTNGKFAMWLFLGTEILFFTALIGTYAIIRIGNPGLWPEVGPVGVLNIPLTAANTFLLIFSSVTMIKAYEFATKDNQKKMRFYLVLTALIGTAFVGVQAFEYYSLIHEGFYPGSKELGKHLLKEGFTADGLGMFASTFFIMTGFHGLHVTAGVIAISCLAVQAFRGKYGKDEHTSIEAVGLYWHFVDLVWIILFTVVYLV